MSEQTDVARPGDEVRAVIKGRVLKVDDHGRVMSLKVAGESAAGLYVPASATVEVLERADDPELGLIRSVAPSADGKPKTAVKVGGRLSQFPDQRSVWVIVETGEVLVDGDVSGIGPAVGSCPGSPAAEAQRPFSVELKLPPFTVGGEVERAQQQRRRSHRRTFPFEVREWMDEEARVECFSGRDADHVVHEGVAIGLTEAPTVRVQKDDGQIVSWVIGLTRRAQSDIDELPEWEQELLEREAAKGREPRVFSSDGPEPPADVLVLKRLNPDDPTRWLYLLRSGGGWEWSPTAHRRIPGIQANPTSWRAAVCSNGGRFQEVTPS